MDLPTVQHQEIGAHNSVENMMVCPNSKTSQDQIRKPRPQPEQALKCPRCDSSNTKFCYYNNYSLSQPRYFCKSCRRYWTQGGTLRNVPVGGGCRKNKRSSSTNSSSSSSSKKPQDHPFASAAAAAAGHLSYDHQANDLSLAFARLHKNSCGSGGGSGHAFNDFDFSVLGMANGDVLNGFAYNSQGMYYDNNDNNMGGIESGGDQMRLQPYDQDHHQYTNATTTAVTVTTMKQELFGGREINNAADGSKILWGYPNWQINGNNNNNNINNGITDSNMMMPMDLDSGSARESWNNAFNNASSWHGLLNSPLM